MIERFNNFTLNEKMDIIEDQTIDLSIFFSDIVNSSDMWKEHKDDMIKALEEQSDRMDKFANKYKGTIIKTIGDAYMMAFNNLLDSIKCAIDIQKDLTDNPIKVNKKNIKIRIGICYGPVYETYINLQGNRLVDYMGNTVNSASRIESKVCKPGNITFSSVNNKNDKNIEKLLEKIDVDMITFNNKGDEIKSSSRLLNDIQRHYYKKVDQLKGVKDLDVYHIKINK